MQNDEGRMKNGGTLILNPSPVREKEDGDGALVSFKRYSAVFLCGVAGEGLVREVWTGG